MKGSFRRIPSLVACLAALLTATGCQGGLSSDGRIAPTRQIPFLSQTAEGYREADSELTNATVDLAYAANDAAWALAAAPFRVLFGLTPFETGYSPSVVDHTPEKSSPETRRKRRRRAMGMQPAAEDRIEERRSRRRLELQRDQQRSN